MPARFALEIDSEEGQSPSTPELKGSLAHQALSTRVITARRIGAGKDGQATSTRVRSGSAGTVGAGELRGWSRRICANRGANREGLPSEVLQGKGLPESASRLWI